MASSSAKNRRSHVGKAKRPRPESKGKKRSAGGPARSGDLLPRCDGPKMHPFKHQQSRILYDSLIRGNNGTNTSKSSDEVASGSDESSSMGDETTSGGEGHVFKVKINSKVYALKLVRKRAALL